ncbi:MAG: hypothetical protein A3E88_05025 [Legionellales bacterium RIFCSPHIGHO2_12_FULL_35_11]|nr:MAG: hypothetical protein A3E88_05025 [Legionellales bacterium RIFCSPHIGHO2_12_FULL_35_11]
MQKIVHYLKQVGILLLCGYSWTSIATPATILRVGTTGDYPPLTFFNRQAQHFEGFDINMATLFAKHMGKKVLFIKSTWSTLSNDLRDNKFDMAVGGISKNPSRAQDFFVSTSVYWMLKLH